MCHSYVTCWSSWLWQDNSRCKIRMLLTQQQTPSATHGTTGSKAAVLDATGRRMICNARRGQGGAGCVTEHACAKRDTACCPLAHIVHGCPAAPAVLASMDRSGPARASTAAKILSWVAAACRLWHAPGSGRSWAPEWSRSSLLLNAHGCCKEGCRVVDP